VHAVFQVAGNHIPFGWKRRARTIADPIVLRTVFQQYSVVLVGKKARIVGLDPDVVSCHRVVGRRCAIDSHAVESVAGNRIA
jgi:hypothetical protein